MKNISELYEREQHPVKFLQIGEAGWRQAHRGGRKKPGDIGK